LQTKETLGLHRNMRVYHFLSTEHALDDIFKRRIKIAQLQDLNDPFELLGANLSDKNTRKVFRAFKKEMEQGYGILCFSRTTRNPVLWSHYADKHKGMCLGFDVRDNTLKEVKYTSKRLVFKSVRDLTKGTAIRLLSTKYQGWSYENEVRSFLSLDEEDEENGLYFADFGDGIKLNEVLAGPGCKVKRKEIMDRLSGYSKVRVIKTRLAFTSFAVVEDKKGFRGN